MINLKNPAKNTHLDASLVDNHNITIEIGIKTNYYL